MATRTLGLVGILMIFLLGLAGRAVAQEAADAGVPDSQVELAQEDRIAELERTVAILADELERTRSEIVVPEEPELVSVYGMGPAASKIYGVDRGLSIGGYAEGFYRRFVDAANGDKDTADFLRAVLYVGYKFTDNIIFNSEYEWEHATSSSTESAGNGSVSVELAQLDFLWKDWANFRAGLMLTPMGFINEIHEPPYFYGVNRPEVERRIIPSTWRENGVGVFGSFGEDFHYKAYVMNGFNAEGFDADGLRGGRQKGNRALAEHLAFVGKLEWTPAFGWLIGTSVYHGKSGQNQSVSVNATGGGTYSVNIPDTPTTIWEVHSEYEASDFHMRSLFTLANLSEAKDLTRALGPVSAVGGGGGTGELGPGEGIGEMMMGAYGEIAYDILPLFFPETDQAFEPFFRFEWIDTQRDMPTGFKIDRSQIWNLYTAGFSWKPVPNVVVKMDYRHREAGSGDLSDELNMGIGLAF